MSENLSIESTLKCAKLLEIPDERRDELWAEEFEKVFPTAIFELKDPQNIISPEGFPYANWSFPKPGSNTIGFSLDQNKNDILKIGCGLSIQMNIETKEPLISMTYGDILNYCLSNKVMTPWMPGIWLDIKFEEESKSQEVKMPKPTHEGTPNHRIIPNLALNMINFYLQKQFPGSGNLRMLEFPGEKFAFAIRKTEKHAEALKALSWLLPMHYTAIAV